MKPMKTIKKNYCKYNEKGLRDAKVIRDTITYNKEEELLVIDLKINEGKTYYFGDITFVGIPNIQITN